MRQPYPRYRSSRVEWLDDVPAHWEIRRLGTALAETVGGGTPDTANESYWADDYEEGLPWVAIADMSAGGEVTSTAKRVTSQGRAAARLRPLPTGTIIYSMYASVGAVARLSMSAATNQAILGLVPGEMLESSYLYWWLTGVRKPVLALTRDNTQSNLNAETVCKIPLALPSLEEQFSIATFLDEETARIDTLISKKRLLLDRLAEFRTALITRTVTKGLPPQAARQAGLNPNPPLKASGVEWIGDIPEHWGVARLKWSATGNVNGVWGDEPNGEDDVICVRVADFDRRGLRVSIASPTLRAVPLSQRAGRSLTAGDLLIEKSGGGEHQLVGCVVLYDHSEPAVCSNFIARVSLAEDAEPRYWTYLHAAIYSGRLNYPAIKQTTGIQNLDAHDYFDTPTVFPPLGEQRHIADFLDEKTRRIEALCSTTELAIERLQEYRTALITAAVTGKIDVREHERVETGASRT